MVKNHGKVFSPKKDKTDYRKIVVYITLVCLIFFALVILFFTFNEHKAAAVKPPQKKIKIKKKEAKAKKVLDDAKMIEKKGVEVVSLEPKKEVPPKPEKAEPEVKEPEKKPIKAEPKKKPIIKPEKVAAVFKKGYYLQLGAFADKDNFDRLKSKIKKLGLPVAEKVTKRSVKSFSVILGRFSSMESAKEAAKEVKRLKYDPVITGVGKGMHEVSIQKILYKSQADDIKEKLKKINIKVRIDKVKSLSDIYMLLVGPYKTEKNTVPVKKKLKKKGYDSYTFYMES